MSLKVKGIKLKVKSLFSIVLLNNFSISKTLVLTFSLFTIHYSVFSQNQKQLVKVGDELIEKYGDYYGASKWYKQALDIDSTYLDIVFKYAESLRKYNDYAKAESKYYYIYKKDRGKDYPLAPFWHATMLKYNGKYNDAKKSFKRAKRFFSRDRKGYHYLKIMNEIKSCEEALNIMRDSIPVDIKNLGKSINTYSSELGGTLLNDSTVIFSSLRDEKMEDDYVVVDTSLYLVRLFKGTKNGDIWKSDDKLDKKINEPNYHIANGCLNSAGDVFYYTRCDRDYNCKVYAIKYTNNNWETPYEIKPVNIDGYTTTQPSIAEIEGKEVLFFASNRPGGKGGKDIWFSRKNDNGNFMAPANAGEVINTIEDEITPFYNSKDSCLYFSSNWHYGLGGFDIFKSKTDVITFEKPKNLGYPINTSTNDFYYNIRNKTALITSNRIGSFTKKGETCCNDIWEYEIPDTTEIIYTTLEELNRYLPVQLYFHNDHPNPRTRDTITELNYFNTYKDYTRLYNEYKREYSAGLKGEEKDDALLDIEDLFSEKIDKGANDLKLFTPLLVKELEAGKTVTLTIKGFASPLSKSDYNVNLTLRRVSSLINYLSEYENGKLLSYINGTAENGAKLSFIKVPFGEYQSVKTISDDLKDKRNSVYSPGAALERKIEIIAIQASDTNQVAMDGSQIEKLPLLTFKDTIIKLEVGQTEKELKIINSGDAPLKIFNATFSCEGFTIDLPGLAIPRMEPLKLKLTYNPTEHTPKKCTVEFLTNTIPNKIVKEIWIE
jgi:tetratricopeptide (TPR) repeat protein